MLIPMNLVAITFILGCLGLALNRAHLLSALLCLELLLAALYYGMAMISTLKGCLTLSSTTMILLALSACEAGAGLALLVSISRTHGSDLVRSLSLLQN